MRRYRRRDKDQEYDRQARMEQLRLKHATLMEEYRFLCGGISQHLGFSNQVFSLTVTIVGALLAGSPFIVEHRVPFLFVVASWMFVAAVLTQLRFAIVVIGTHNHIVGVIAPEVVKLLRAIHPGPHDDYSAVLSWEREAPRAAYGPVWVTGWIILARYWVPLAAAVLSFVAYFYFGNARFEISLRPNGLLCIGETVLLLYTVIMVVWIGKSAIKPCDGNPTA